MSERTAMTQQATKVLNKQVKQALEKTIDLRSLAQEPPKENPQECLRLMGSNSHFEINRAVISRWARINQTMLRNVKIIKGL